MSRSVLLVDDDDLIREVTTAALELVGGWTVISASGGPQALELIKKQRPDAVLMDVMMPGMDGPTVFSRMQADPELRDIPTILLTAKAQSGDRRQWQHLPIAGVITKPFDPMTLASSVSRLLGWSTGDGGRTSTPSSTSC